MGGEELREELVLELQRSLYYAKQRYKSIVEEINILLPPPWLDDSIISRIKESLNVPVRSIPLQGGTEALGPISILHLLLDNGGLISQISNIMPAELFREKELRKLSGAFVTTELCLICLLILWTYNNLTIYRGDYSLYQKKLYFLKALEERLDSHKEEFLRIQGLKEQATEVKEYLLKRPFINLYIATLSYILPPQIHLESLRWRQEEKEVQAIAGQPKGMEPIKKTSHVLTLSGRIDSEKSDERYTMFFQLINNLKKVPSIRIIKTD